MSKKVYFYQNNPCTIVNEINDDFVEISINHKYGAEMELMCMGCAVGDSDNKLSCTCSDHEWVIEQVQEEDHLCLVIARRIYLREDPIEYFDIAVLKKEIEKERKKLNETKIIHEEWRTALKSKKLKIESMNHEIESLKLDLEANRNIREQSENGLDCLTEKYNKIVVAIDYGSKRITTKEYDKLLKRDGILSALEAAGVDNWECYDESMENAELNS